MCGITLTVYQVSAWYTLAAQHQIWGPANEHINCAGRLVLDLQEVANVRSHGRR
jgi:hypothetical protein